MFLLLCLAFGPRPTLLHALPRPPERQRIRRNIVRNTTRGRNVRSPPNLDRRNQRRIAADEHAIFDDCLVLVDSVVIARDRPRANVHAFTDFRVAQIAQVIRLRSLASLIFLVSTKFPT